ncbi:glycosyl hydrolase family 28-related protein [Arthrobacter sp. NPDC056727]|uniref:glycosyl hydrolase family 28-related protein n=1 Tax=Arthrobacter sp. NPDC056727 TaxID=3345927 RepID=UPI00367038DF
MASENDKRERAESRSESGVMRRGFLRIGTLATAFTCASAVSTFGATSAQAGATDATTLQTYVPITEKGAAWGVAALDVNAKVPLTQLPDFSASYGPDSQTMGAKFIPWKSTTTNVKDPQFGAKGDGITDDTVAIQAAIDYASTQSKGLFVPGGDYVTGTLNIPTGMKISGDGSKNTRFRRIVDVPILRMVGPGYSGTGAYMPSIYGVTVLDLDVYNSAAGSTSPLVLQKGASACTFERVQFESYSSGAPLLEQHQVWDSKYRDCRFHGGGSTTGTGAVRMLSGYGGYRQTKENFFTDCWWESYYGPAIEAARPAGYTDTKTGMLLFANCKMESRVTTGPHMVLTANNISFANTYITFEKTAGPIVDFASARAIYGDLTFHYIVSTDAVTPTALINIPSTTNYVKLDVIVPEPQPTGANIVTLADTNDRTIDLNISAREPLINGNTNKIKLLPYSNVRQLVTGGTSTCQYVFAKSGLPDWVLGNPSTDGTNYDWFIRNGAQNFMTFRSRGLNPATSYREVIMAANLALGGTYSDPNLLNLGSYKFWMDSAGLLRRKKGTPSSETDGNVVGGGATTASKTALLSATNSINTTGKYQGRQVYCTTIARPVWTNGTTATSPWLFADGTTAFRPV